jgi:EAL domain-containing protein (putative c-di-GMP-specific phosphodiesterase class I)
MQTACNQARVWQNQGHRALRMGINLSSHQFRQHNLISIIRDLLSDIQLPACFLDLEITESALMDDIAKTTTILNELKEIGVSVSIDDFGTGYSSMSYLKQFPLDTLKIDQSFVRDLVENSPDAAIAKAIIALAQGLKLETIAEGVETQEQWDFLKSQGCDYIQGYFISKPVPAEQVCRLF